MKKSASSTKRTGRQWQLQEAKNRLSHVVESARNNGPQTITLRGKPSVVVVAFEEYSRLTRPRSTLLEFLRKSPLRGVELDIERSTDPGREVEL